MSGLNLMAMTVCLTGKVMSAGATLVKAEYDRLTHIVNLATSILKASLCYVVLGQQDKMVLAKACGTDDNDDSWLPAACAWSLSQEPGLLVIENMLEDSRSPLPLVFQFSMQLAT